MPVVAPDVGASLLVSQILYMGTPDYEQRANLENDGDSFLLKSHIQAATAGTKYTF